MLVARSRRPILAFATLALGIALGSPAAVAARPMHAPGKPLVWSHAQVHETNSLPEPRAFAAPSVVFIASIRVTFGLDMQYSTTAL